MTYLKGDIFYVMKYSNVIGSEIDNGRPAVIVSNNIGNQYSEVVEVVYLTTKAKKPLPTHVPIMCKEPSTALCEQISSISKERIGDYICTVTDEEMIAIDKALKVSLGITDSETEKEFNRIINIQSLQIDSLITTNTRLLEEANKAKLSGFDIGEIMKAQIERDTYKAMYERLLTKLI